MQVLRLAKMVALMWRGGVRVRAKPGSGLQRVEPLGALQVLIGQDGARYPGGKADTLSQHEDVKSRRIRVGGK